MELRQEGSPTTEIRAREAEIRANAHESTLRSLKEFFLLAKIAEAEEIKVEDEDLEVEIEAIAARTDESSRRVRARVEKEGLADALASQILERKTLDRILEFVKFEEVPLDEPRRPSRRSTRRRRRPRPPSPEPRPSDRLADSGRGRTAEPAGPQPVRAGRLAAPAGPAVSFTYDSCAPARAADRRDRPAAPAPGR